MSLKLYSKRAKYTKDYLLEFCKDNNIILISNFENNEKIDRDTKIKGECYNELCKEYFNINFRSLVEKNLKYCKKCSNEITNKKRQETCLEKYGVYHAIQNKEIQKKIENTNILKYGGKSPANSREVQEKIKKTTFENHGVYYSTQSKSILDKIKNTTLKNKGKEYFEYSKESLNKYCIDNKIILLDDELNNTNIDFYNDVKREDNIYFICIIDDCNEKCHKTYRQIKEVSGFFCQKHTNENMVIKFKENYMINTGYEHPMKNPEVVEKAKKSLNEIYSDDLRKEEIMQKTINTNRINNGVDFPQQSEEIRNKTKITFLKNTGYEHPMKNPEVVEKLKQTNLKLRGYENPFQDPLCKEKSKQTNLKLRGVEYSLQDPLCKEKSKETCLLKYGVEYSLQDISVRNKGKETCLLKYGYEHPMHNPEYAERLSKIRFKYKDYIFPSGKIIQYQGFENFALDDLLKDGICEEDIFNGFVKVPEIWYNYKNKKHRYYVDIYIPNKNLCIEVKSEWTLNNIDKDQVLIKQESVKNHGYECQIWVYGANGKKIECHK